MANDIINESNFLKTLFNKKYYSFLNNTDLKLEELEKLESTQIKRKESMLNYIYNTSEYKNNTKLYDSAIDKIEVIIDEIISDIKELKKEIKKLNQAVIRLIVDKEIESKYKTQDVTQTVLYIKDEIDEFEKLENEVNNSIQKIGDIITKAISKESKESALQNDIQDEEFTSANEQENLNDKTTILDIEKIKEISSPNIEEVKEEKKEPVVRRQGSAINSIAALCDNKKIDDNNTLLISEKDKKVYLPYTVAQLNEYLLTYPDEFKSYEDVIKSEFELPLEIFIKNQSLARFKETYELIRNKEMKSMFEAMKQASKLMFKYDLNPAVIAACNSKVQLDSYLDCLENKKIEDFNCFDIKFDLNLL